MRIIADIGSNWKTKTEKELYDLIDSLWFVDYIKFQAWDTKEFVNTANKSYQTYKQFELPKEKYKELFEYIGFDRFMVTCFDITTIHRFKELGNINWKIASSDITYLDMIKLISSFKDETWISTGNATELEIKTAMNLLHSDTTVLHCIPRYPTLPEDAGLANLIELKRTYPKVGLSCHTQYPDIKKVVGASAVIGSEVLEVHVKHQNTIDTPDAFFSLTPTQLKSVYHEIDTYYKMLNYAQEVENFNELARRKSNNKR